MNEGFNSKCYIIFDYGWHITGVKPVRTCFKSFDSIKEAGEYLISLFSRDMDEGIFESLLSDEELDQVKTAVSELKQALIVNETTDFSVNLDLSCFEFKIPALCVWPKGVEKVLEIIVGILQENQVDESHLFYQKVQALLKIETSALDREKFDDIFDHMIENHSCEGTF